MLVEDGKYYLYRHVRLDTNKPFYIGIGTKLEGTKTYLSQYRRAYTKSNRNSYWKSIVNNTEHKVEILLESDSYTFIQDKEKELIKLYGRKSDGGTLCNIEGGGVCVVNRDFSYKKVVCCNDGLWYDNIGKAADFYNLDRTSITRVVLNQAAYTDRFVFANKICDCKNIQRVERYKDETFIDVIGFEDNYLVSNFGRIVKIKYSVKNKEGEVFRYKEQLVSPVVRNSNTQVSLSSGKNYYTYSIKKVVYCSFNNLNLDTKGLYLKVLNGDNKDARLNNLEVTSLLDVRRNNKNKKHGV